MNKAIIKFVDFLDQEAIRIQNNFIKECTILGGYNVKKLDDITYKISECHNISRQLKVPEKDYSLHGEIFIQFDILSHYLNISNLTPKEASAIILTFLRKNIAAGICESESNAFDPKEIDSYPFKTVTPEEVHQLIHEDRYRILMSKSEEERTPKENALIEELEEYTKTHPTNVDIFKNIHQKINEHYFSIQDSYTEDDIYIFIEQLRKLNLSEKYCQILTNYLINEINKRKNKQTISTQKYTPKKIVKSETTSLSKKEINTLYRELCTYYNPDTKVITRYLTLQEIIYCLSIMRKLNFNKESLSLFLKTVEKFNRQQEVNPLSQYIELYNKLLYYKDRLDLEDDLSSIESIIQEMFIVSDKDYVEWKKLLAEELSNLLRSLSGNHDYEIEKSLSLSN